MKRIISVLIFSLFAVFHYSCSSDEPQTATPPVIIEDSFIRAADVSFLPEIETSGTILYHNGLEQDMLTTLKNAGCNAIRIRLWKDPSTNHSGMTEVKSLAQRAKLAGLKVWLTVHYSDTWADPGTQTTPTAWQSLSFSDLKTAVTTYTTTILNEINPDIFQIGNEINSGLLWPKGHLINNEQQCLEILTTASTTIRTKSPNTKIMLHFAGISGSDWFFNKVKNIDYDYIGLSYYPVWHGKDLNVVKTTINNLGANYNKKVLIAEVAYPFSLGWNDWTNNIVGLESQLVSGYEATPLGQLSFMASIKNMLKTTAYGQGFSYWGGEWISFKGNEATNGSSFENQAFYDFENNSLPVFQVYNND